MQKFLNVISIAILLIILFPNTSPLGYSWAQSEFEPMAKSAGLPQAEDAVWQYNRVLQLQIIGDWSELFEILSENYLQGESKNEYVSRHGKYKRDSLDIAFRAFVPMRIIPHSRSTDFTAWKVEGCGKWGTGDNEIEQKSFVILYWGITRREWRSTEFSYDLPLHGGYFPCEH